MAPSEERVANGKILVNQWRNEHSFRDELSHHLVFTKNDEEPTSFTLVGPNLAKGQILANSNPVRPHRRCSPVWS